MLQETYRHNGLVQNQTPNLVHFALLVIRQDYVQDFGGIFQEIRKVELPKMESLET